MRIEQEVAITRNDTLAEQLFHQQMMILEKQEKMSTQLDHSNSMRQLEMQQIAPILESLLSMAKDRSLQPTDTNNLAVSHKFTDFDPISESQKPRVRVKRLQCLDGCPCRCHSHRIFRSPFGVSPILGDFFLRYRRKKLTECDVQTCRGNERFEAILRFVLPSFVSRVANIQFNIALRAVPFKLLINTRTTIPYDSPIFIFVQEGNIEGIKDLLISGKASLSDVDPYGLGLLYVGSQTQRMPIRAHN